MHISVFITQASETLRKANVQTARLDTLILLEDAIQKDRGWLLAHPEYEIDDKTARLLQKQIERRITHEPLAYIREKSEFYGREFKVNVHTLEPRPESETMIELFKSIPLPTGATLGDIGCGSGALGITAALEKPGTEVVFIDIDKDALAVAKYNARRHKVRGQYYLGNLLDAWPIPYDVLLCNLPYVPNDHTINQAAMQEPSHAIFGGLDGLDLFRTLFKQLEDGTCGKPIVLTESLPFQHTELAMIAQQHGYELANEVDFIQLFKNYDRH